jgi:N,N'-diacetyllegionaminate synthase
MNKVIIIAEAGVNHNGDIDMARKLIEVAAEAGADYVKFQTFKAENLVSKEAKQAAYQQKNTGGEETQFEMLKRLELKFEDHYGLKEYAEKKGIKFLSTGFDSDSIEFLYQLGMDFFKIPSGEITNYFYLKQVAQKGLPIVLSTGMSNLQEVEEAVNLLAKNGISRTMITILHCNTQYPSPIEDANIEAMVAMKEKFNVEVGYSDHTNGYEVSMTAVAMGAVIIEKHFTLDKNLPGPDHKASLNPAELKEFVEKIRLTEIIKGKKIKEPTNSERENIPVGRKSLHALRNIKKGEILSEENVFACRPGSGINPMEWEQIKGRKARTNIEFMQLFKKEDIE